MTGRRLLGGRRVTLGIWALSLFGAAHSAAAQTSSSEIDALRAQIKALQERLDKIEAAQKAAPTPPPSAVPAGAVQSASKLPVTVSGLLQVHGTGFFSQDSAFPRQADSFRLRRGELRVTAPQITDRISGTIMIDPAKALSNNPFTVPAVGASVTPAINQSTTVFQELQLSYLLHKAKRGNHYFDIGQFKLPIGYEGDLNSSGQLQAVERALMFQARDPFGGAAGDIRDTGAELRGTFDQFDYRLGVFNGLGERQNTTAAGDPKALVGRLVFKPRAVNGLQVGVSGGTGDTRNIPASGSQAKRDVFNLFSVYKRKKVTFQAEYLDGKAQTIAAAPGATRDIKGYYGSFGYLFTPRLEGVARYEYFDFDRDLVGAPGASSDASVKDLILGVNYYIKGHNAKIQANIVRRNGGAGLVAANGFTGNPTGFNQDRTELRTNFQVAF